MVDGEHYEDVGPDFLATPFSGQVRNIFISCYVRRSVHWLVSPFVRNILPCLVTDTQEALSVRRPDGRSVGLSRSS